MTVGVDRPSRFGGDAVTFEDMREFLVACSGYKHQMHIPQTNIEETGCSGGGENW